MTPFLAYETHSPSWPILQPTTSNIPASLRCWLNWRRFLMVIMIMHLQCCERSCLVFAVSVVELCWSQAVSCSAQQRQWSAPCSRYQHPSHSSIPPWAVQHTPFTSTQLFFNKHSLTMRMFFFFRLPQWCNWGTHEPRNRNQWSKKILL